MQEEKAKELVKDADKEKGKNVMQEVPKIHTKTWVQQTFQSINFPSDNFGKEKKNLFLRRKWLTKMIQL